MPRFATLGHLRVDVMNLLTRLSSGRQSGASLVEVLVSIVIAAVGLLALAGINAASLRYGKLSQYRAVATLLANDISERMRATGADTAALASYAVSQDFATQATLSGEPTPTCRGAADNCTTAQMAAADLWQWRNTVRANLPEGSVFVIPYAAQRSADVWVVWRDAAVAEQVAVNGSRECPDDLDRTDDTVRCMYFRVRL